MYSFTNNFSGSTLRRRIDMINRSASGGSAWWRYVAWGILMGVMAFACKYKNTTENQYVKNNHIEPTNATRALAYEFEKEDAWQYPSASLLNSTNQVIINGRKVTSFSRFSYPEILCLRNNHLSLKNTDSQAVKLFINGQEKEVATLSTLTFDELDDVLIYQKSEYAPKANTYPEMYRILISTTHKTDYLDPIRNQWRLFLITNAISDHPLGQSNTFSMNQLLEATFFHNKLAFVERTKDEHLKIYDELMQDIETYIDGEPVPPKQIESVHVREVDRLYTRERPFDEWNSDTERKSRFVLYVQTAPTRTNRDSTYYVFSPFYSGDF